MSAHKSFSIMVIVLIRITIMVMLIPLFVYIILYASSITRLEWVDENGKGNGFCHELLNHNGEHCMSFRLSDYGNTNKVYQLLIFSENKINLIISNEVDISILRFSQEGELQDSYIFTGLFGDIVNGFYLPLSCSPQSQGEKLEIKVVVYQSKYPGNFHTLAPKQKVKMEARLICEKVRHFPSV